MTCKATLSNSSPVSASLDIKRMKIFEKGESKAVAFTLCFCVSWMNRDLLRMRENDSMSSFFFV